MSTKLTDLQSIEQIIREMSLEEKATIITGGSPFAAESMEQYGIPSAVLLDGATGFNSMKFGAEIGFKMAMDEMRSSGKDPGGFLIDIIQRFIREDVLPALHRKYLILGNILIIG